MVKSRKIFAAVFFAIALFSFIDLFGILSPKFEHIFYQSQLIPSILNSIATGSIISIIFLIVLFLLSFFFGRVYCSFICPLGILQDVLDRIYSLFKKKKRYKYKKPYNIFRYAVLFLVVISLLTGTAIGLNITDPYSNFGRIISNVFLPVIKYAYNAIVVILEKFEIYAFYAKPIYPVPLFSILFAVFILTLITVLVYKRGRLYCNTICPVGSFLGLIARGSLYKIRIHESLCGSCGKCVVVCKSECVDLKQKHVDVSRCVACYNCLKVCEKNAIGFSRLENKNVESAQKGRRDFFKRSAISFGALNILFAKKGRSADENHKLSTTPEKKNYTVSPPGSEGIEKFNSLCTACHLCVNECITGVLRPSFTQYGLIGVNQPFMNYRVNYCNFECTVCGEVCPTGAIKPLSIESKKQTQIGKVYFEINNCIVKTENTACGACSEHCPTQAVYMVPYENGHTIPEINPEICVGCGACEYACPVKPYKAIYVDGNLIHQVAKKPEIEKAIAPDTEDFPF